MNLEFLQKFFGPVGPNHGGASLYSTLKLPFYHGLDHSFYFTRDAREITYYLDDGYTKEIPTGKVIQILLNQTFQNLLNMWKAQLNTFGNAGVLNMFFPYENAKKVSNRKICYFRQKIILYYHTKKNSLDKNGC